MEEIRVDPINQASQEISLWCAVRRRWIQVALVALGVFGLAAFKTFKEIPEYQSQSLILVVKKTAVPVIRSSESSASSSSKDEAEKDLSTEIEILRSPTLLAKALKKLEAPYQTLSVEEIAPNLSLILNEDANVLSVSYTDTDPQRAQAVLEALVPTYISYNTESTRSPVTNAVRFIERKLPEARAELNRSSSAITTFRTKYNLDDPDVNAALAFKTKEELQQRVAEAELNLNQTKQVYQELQRQMAQVGQDPKTVLTDSVLSQDQTYQDLLSQLKAIEVQYELESTRFSDAHPMMQTLKDRRDKIQQLLQSQARRVIGTQPSQAASQSLVSGEIRQSFASQLLQSQTNSLVQAKQLQDLRQMETQAVINFQQVVKIQQHYKELQRQYLLNSQTVDNFLAKLQELRIREAQEISSWKVLEAPYLPTVAISSPKRGLLMGGIVGILLGIGVAYLLEKADQRIKELREVRDLTGLPLLGAIPKVNLKTLAAGNKKFNLSERSNPYTEAIRSLALALLFQKSSHNGSRNGKAFAITSSIVGEGKTTITCHLGLALAELGQRVLIVDADLNRPMLHQVFGLPNVAGLSTAIASELPWHELIQSGQSYTQESPNRYGRTNSSQGFPQTESSNDSHPILAQALLEEANTINQNQPLVFRYPDIMTSGPLPSHSFAWLASNKMIQLLDRWRQAYDWVLIDTPPIAELADAQSLVPKVDEVILVVGLECSTRSIVSRTTEILQSIQGNLTGVVANYLPQKGAGYYQQHDYFSLVTRSVKSTASKFRRF